MTPPDFVLDWPPQDEAIRAALLAAWADGSWGRYQGGHVERLEQQLANQFQVPHVAVCCSGSFAVELALRALKVGPGDEVVLAAYDYFGNFLSVHAVGAIPVLVDVDPLNWNLDPNHLTAALGPATRAILVSHLHGGIVPMHEVLAEAAPRGIPVIEDAAQAPGARIQGRPAGTWGDVGILSFGGSKLLSAGRGGALLTRNAALFQRAKLHLSRGGNLVYGLSELQAAVLLPQLQRLPERHAQRLHSVNLLASLLQDIPGLRLFTNRVEDSEPAYYKVGFQLDSTAMGLTRPQFLAALQSRGVPIDTGFQAFHIGRSPTRYRAPNPLPEAERAHAGTVVLHHPILASSDADLERLAEVFHEVVQPTLGGDGLG
jgi:dTDP-4-amino-4,6-dideoxygalactose transaminase